MIQAGMGNSVELPFLSNLRIIELWVFLSSSWELKALKEALYPFPNQTGVCGGGEINKKKNKDPLQRSVKQLT